MKSTDADDFNNRNTFLTSKLLKQGYQYHKLCKAFSKFYYLHSELLKDSSASRHIRAAIYGDLVDKFKRIVGKPNFSDQFKNIV